MPIHPFLRGARSLALGLLTSSALTPIAFTSIQAQSTGAVAGRVVSRESSTPIPGAVVNANGALPVTQTDAAGSFLLEGLVAGSHTLQVRRVGYSTTAIAFEIAAGATTTLEVILSEAPSALGTVTVIGTRTDLDETRDLVESIPGGATLIEPGEIRATRQANLKDVLQFTPGVYVQPRFGAADESQISVRGSGLRNNFHARGINLLVNGMPYRNADGFTDFESLELLTTEAIAVYKGANALRYGGSTLGGAINFDTKTGHTAAPLSLYAQSGSHGFAKAQASSGAVLGGFDYYASYAHSRMNNYRDWADQRRDRVNLHAGYRISPTLDARSFYFFARVEEHLPGALTREELESDATQAVPINVTDRWGRDYDLHHIGFQLRGQITPTQRIEVSPYAQYRDIDHPIFEVISQVSRDYGMEVRYENTTPLGALGNRLTIGVQPAYENMDNRQFVNEAGDHGALTRDEKNEVRQLGAYIEDALEVTDRFTVVAGARYDHSQRIVDDRFLANGNQSARRVYRPVTPRIGLLYTVPKIGGSVFANASRTVEPPLLLELSSFGNPGGFIDLEAQKAWQYELGARGRRLGLGWEISLFDIELEDEILNINVRPFPDAPFTVPSYRNADRTRHYGAELGFAWQLPGAVFLRDADLPDHLTTRVAYTFAKYEYVDDARFAGNDLPGAPRHHLNAEVKYVHPSGVSIAPQLEIVPRSFHVDSENTTRNDRWATLGIRAEWAMEGAGLVAFAEGRNLLDERYSASVQVDNAAGRYFEPADRRSIYAGVRWSR